MVDTKKYNLDEDVRESFRFSVKGHEYDFRQMTTEEIDNFQKLKGEREIREYLYTFVTPVNKESPAFTDLSKKMIAPHWRNFIKMVKVEMMGEQDGSN